MFLLLLKTERQHRSLHFSCLKLTNNKFNPLPIPLKLHLLTESKQDFNRISTVKCKIKISALFLKIHNLSNFLVIIYFLT
jgi:hypothetical protein